MSRAPARMSKPTILIFAAAIWLVASSLAVFFYFFFNSPLISFFPTQEELTRSSRINFATGSLLFSGVALLALFLSSLIADNRKNLRKR
jgi:hypothetical protein